MKPIRSAQLWALVVLTMALFIVPGCGEGKKCTVTGFWKVLLDWPTNDDPDVSHWLLEQNGTKVTGQFCSPDKTDCKMPLDGTFANPMLVMTANYEKQSTTYTFSTSLELNSNGDTLIGTGETTESDDICAIEATLLER